MKKIVNSLTALFHSTFYIVVGLMLMFSANTTKAADVNLLAAYPDHITIQLTGYDNACVSTPHQDHLYYKIEGYNNGFVEIPNGCNQTPEDIYFTGMCPTTSITVDYQIRRMGGYWYWGNWICNCDYSEYPIHTYTLPAYYPVTNVQASNGAYQSKVVITWSINELFNANEYQVFRNGVPLSGYLPAGTNTYTDAGLIPGVTYSYTVESWVNGCQGITPTANDGSTFNLNFQASTNAINKVVLTWNNFSGTYACSGYTINYSDDTLTTQAITDPSNNYTSFQHTSPLLIPGFTYNYTFYVNPQGTSDVVGTASGKERPDGKISGSVKTPVTINNPAGVGVPNVEIIAVLQGPALPTDTTTTYIAYTNANGDYTIPNIYYFYGATYRVTPVLAGRTFSPVHTDVALDLNMHLMTANFTDMSSFVVSGTVAQNGCPMAGVQMLLDGANTNIVTDINGNYNITIANGGSYTVTPKLETHLFAPADSVVSVTSNLLNVNFSDTKVYTLEGNFGASCNQYVGVATLRFYSSNPSGCISDTVTTNLSGYYSIVLPARDYNIDLLQFTSFDEQILPSVNVMAFFSQIHDVNLTLYDSLTFHHDTTTLNFVYRQAPQLLMSGLNAHVTCSGELLPVLQQHANITIDLDPEESFNGAYCPAGDGYIIINENISSNGTDINTDTIYYHQYDTIRYQLTPGVPNIISPFKKFIQAILVRDNQTDTAYADVIVVGQRPRSQTFTTVSPEMPFHIIHNPPGDNSYAYLDQNSSISNSFTTSFLQEGSLDTYIRAQLGLDFSVELGFIAGVSTEITAENDITATFGLGTSGLSTDATQITTTTDQMFQTSGEC